MARSGMNLVVVSGNLTKNPELKYTTSGKPVCNFSIAINNGRKPKEGEPEPEPEYVKIVAWEKKAEVAGQYLSTGSGVLIRGRLQTRSWMKGEEKRYSTEVVVDELIFLGGGRPKEEAPVATAASDAEWTPPAAGEADIPF